VADDVMVRQNPSSSKDIPGQARDLHRLPDIIQICECLALF
jgi:hypothetical protein